jgi:hypothetical protein
MKTYKGILNDVEVSNQDSDFPWLPICLITGLAHPPVSRNLPIYVRPRHSNLILVSSDPNVRQLIVLPSNSLTLIIDDEYYNSLSSSLRRVTLIIDSHLRD